MNGKSGNALEGGDFAVRALPYGGKAPLIFEQIMQFSRNVVPHPLKVDHIGSTTVPGSGGKGITEAETYFEPKKQLSREAGSDGAKYTELKNRILTRY